MPGIEATPVLAAAGVWAGYGGTPILQGVDLAIGRGEIVGLIGRNGVGKTTAMRCLIGLLRSSAGTIRLMGEDVTGRAADARARAGIGYVPQGRDVFPRMTVEENLVMGELIGGPRGRKLVDLVYQRFPILVQRRRQMAGTLSGGEQQQLAIGRALIGNPSIMLLDEPSEGIQPSIVQMICEALRAVRDELGTTFLFVEQNLDTILDMGERCYVMDKGRIVTEIPRGGVTEEAVRAQLLL
ncbi:ABC transporter ATP-binding protein [Paracraurococcus lichenis]|uniref:ABC transporter ATP-binding protein n=1 Tax=Paracraurococcus lichenis TaxID=3064888 RepID=A0ABT9E174_9PROT|nr:ABC transporter ATP-binding protein [Paracraurococcus sp. LOR1-02]MDO9709912.1 ABC transporter ATP-binding protein [Paracraurococcus sp. LOR1-02]